MLLVICFHRFTPFIIVLESTAIFFQKGDIVTDDDLLHFRIDGPIFGFSLAEREQVQVIKTSRKLPKSTRTPDPASSGGRLCTIELYDQFKMKHVMFIASVQYFLSRVALNNRHLALSTSVRLIRRAIPFCRGVYPTTTYLPPRLN